MRGTRWFVASAVLVGLVLALPSAGADPSASVAYDVDAKHDPRVRVTLVVRAEGQMVRETVSAGG